MKFSVEDVALVATTVDPYWANYVGTECIIKNVGPFNHAPEHYRVILYDGTYVYAYERNLRSRGDEAGSWKALEDIWKPKELIRQQTTNTIQ